MRCVMVAGDRLGIYTPEQRARAAAGAELFWSARARRERWPSEALDG
jgi:hypothetical protein